MKKILKVAVVTVPTELDGISYGSEEENVNQQAKDMLNALNSKLRPSLSSKGISLKITREHCKGVYPSGMFAVKQPDVEGRLKKFGERISKRFRKYDQVIILAGGHHGALPAYYFPGKALNVDQHFDLFHRGNQNKLTNGNYLSRVIGNLKDKNEIELLGQRTSFAQNLMFNLGMMPGKPRKKIDILDIDMDVFPDTINLPRSKRQVKPFYGPLAPYSAFASRQDMRKDKIPRVSDIGKIIIKSKPKVLSISEFDPRNVRAQSVGKAIIEGYGKLAIAAAAERKFGVKIFNRKRPRR